MQDQNSIQVRSCENRKDPCREKERGVVAESCQPIFDMRKSVDSVELRRDTERVTEMKTAMGNIRRKGARRTTPPERPQPTDVQLLQKPHSI